MDLQAIFISFGLVFLAEFGDKSQLVCMTLASRRPAKTVFAGALTALALLNLVAVLVGASLAKWLPLGWVLSAAALLFAWFGVQAIWEAKKEEEEECEPCCGRRVYFSTFSMIALAELGDKTQLSIGALSIKYDALWVWLGATAALAATTAAGVLLGKALFSRINLIRLHQLSGIFFLFMAVLTGWRAYASF